MSRSAMQDQILDSIMKDPTSDYNIGLVREAVRTYLNCFSDDELSCELNDRVNFGLVSEATT
jgi:hypothetical protein